MNDNAYRTALDAALREYERIAADRAALDARIVQLQQTIGTLTRLCGLAPTVPMGLTDACRLVLRGSHTPMTAIQVRERLEAIGVMDLAKYANALSAIHTTLKRLNEGGEAVSVDLDDSSRTAYQIISPIRPPARVVVIDTRPRPESGRSRGKGQQK